MTRAGKFGIEKKRSQPRGGDGMNYIERKKHNFPRAEARGFGKAVEERRNHTIGISIAESVKIWRNPLSDIELFLLILSQSGKNGRRYFTFLIQWSEFLDMAGVCQYSGVKNMTGIVGGLRMVRLILTTALLCTLVLSGTAFAQEVKEVPRKDIDEMVKRGVEWLKKAQAADGSWDFLDKPFSCGVHASGKGLGEGCTAFCTFALIKAGVSRKDPVVQKGFQNAMTRIKSGDSGFCHCYCVACLILLLETIYTDDEPAKAEDTGKKAEK